MGSRRTRTDMLWDSFELFGYFAVLIISTGSSLVTRALLEFIGHAWLLDCHAHQYKIKQQNAKSLTDMTDCGRPQHSILP